MIRNNISMTIKTLKAMKDNPSKDTIDFNSPIQRKSGMWDCKRKSLLINSILMSTIFSVPTVYFRKDMIADKKYRYSVIDGIQRITTIFDYIDNQFPLTEVPPVIIDGVTYDVSGKFFSDLEQDCQQEIIRFKMRIEAFEPEDGDTEEYVNNTIEEVFSRLNSAVPLTSAQLCKAKAGTNVAILLNELLTSKFFTESACFTKSQIKTSDDQRCLLQAMMLLDRNYVSGFQFKDFSEVSLMAYAEKIKKCYSDMQSNLLRSTVEYLTEAFPVSDKQLKKINIPILLYMADVAEDNSVKPMYFRQWWAFFTQEDTLFESYKMFCSSGSTKLEKVNGRLAIMTLSICRYFKFEIPEELKELVAEVEEKLALVKEEDEEFVAEEAILLEEKQDCENSNNKGEQSDVTGQEAEVSEQSEDTQSPVIEEEPPVTEEPFDTEGMGDTPAV